MVGLGFQVGGRKMVGYGYQVGGQKMVGFGFQVGGLRSDRELVTLRFDQKWFPEFVFELVEKFV